MPGYRVKITRRLEWGRIPLPDAADDPGGQYSVAQVPLRDIMEAKNPQENIPIMPNDVITVPQARMVYVIGDVNKPGSMILGEQETMSVLEALSIASGLGKTAKAKETRILRATAGAPKRVEVPVNLKDILAGKTDDMPLQAEDILFVPTSTSKVLALKAVDALIGSGLTAVIYRGMQ